MINNERTWLIAWATLQGFCLLMLHNLVVSLDKPGEWFVVTWPLYTLALVFPLSMQMLSAYRERMALWLLSGGYALLVAACAAYAGKVGWVDGLSRTHVSGATFLIGGIIFTSWFVLIPFAEHRLKLASWSRDYALLCSVAWRNVFKLASAGLFVGIFWILLGLWAGLFKVLGVSFFVDLFTSRHFVYPVTAIAFGLGLSLYSAKEEALLGLYRATLNLLGWLLPLVSGIILLFLLMLPVKGVALLWKTGYATALMLSLQGLMVFLFNAAWQDGVHGIKFPGWIRKLVTLALLVLPVLSAFCVYSLWLRVEQYGWTADRVWAAILIGLLAVYALGYALSVLRLKAEWMQTASKVNIYAAWIVVLVLLLTATPVLDPARISVSSQLDKLLSKKVDVQSFDFEYLRFDGGLHGQRALKYLTELTGHPQAEDIQLKAKASLEAKHRTYGRRMHVERDREAWQRKLDVYPQGRSLTTDFVEFLWQLTEGDKFWINCLRNQQSCTVLLVDLNRDGQDEVVIFGGYGGNVFTRMDGQWQSVGFMRHRPGSGKGEAGVHRAPDDASTRRMIANGEFSVEDNDWRELQVGEWRYGIQP